jgi:hypothetical protein
MTDEKKKSRKSFGRSFESAYLSTASDKFANPLLYLEVPKKPKKKEHKKTPMVAGVSDPKIRKEPYLRDSKRDQQSPGRNNGLCRDHDQ